MKICINEESNEAETLPNLGETREIYRYLLGTRRRLARDENLRKQYVSFMEEHQKLGNMWKVEGTDEKSPKRCFLLHHPVVKEASATTK